MCECLKGNIHFTCESITMITWWYDDHNDDDDGDDTPYPSWWCYTTTMERNNITQPKRFFSILYLFLPFLFSTFFPFYLKKRAKKVLKWFLLSSVCEWWGKCWNDLDYFLKKWWW